MIIGLGTDIIAVERIRRVYTRHGARFLERTYTAEEQRWCLRARDPGERLAARWAAKEATMKALGTGWAGGITFRDIAIANDPASGAPRLLVTGAAAAHARTLGGDRWHVSLSHADGMAVATVILESGSR